MPNQPLLALQCVQKQRPGMPPLDVPELLLNPGDIVGVLEHSGDARHALLALCAGQSTPSSGSVTALGHPLPHDWRHAAAQVGVLWPSDGLDNALTVAEQLRFEARLHGCAPTPIPALLARVALADQANLPTQQLDAGACRRLALARALIHAPRLLLLADPFARCDASSTRIIADALRHAADQGTAALLCDNARAPLERCCTVLYELVDGRLGEHYQPEQPAAADEHAPRPLLKLPVRGEDKVVLLNPGDVLYATTRDGRAYLKTADAEWQSRFTMSELEDKLTGSGFFRAHRAFLLNLQHAREIITYTRSSFAVIMSDGSEVPLSKLAAQELQNMLGY